MADGSATFDSHELEIVFHNETRLLSSLAGALQMIFYHQSSEGAASGDQLGQITLPQFRAIMQAAKVINARFLAEKVLLLVTDT